MDESKFELIASKELEHIHESIDDSDSKIFDEVTCELHDGVLTIECPRTLGGGGTFVLNKHSASRQIWYSSPVSSPAYFDPPDWISKKLGGVTLRQKLGNDLSILFNQNISISE
jgi:frataxin-like iron-binding protein CyaY